MGNDKRPPVFGEGSVVTKRARAGDDQIPEIPARVNKARPRKGVITNDPFVDSDLAWGSKNASLGSISNVSYREVTTHADAYNARARHPRPHTHVRRLDPDEGLSLPKGSGLSSEVRSVQLRSLLSAPLRPVETAVTTATVTDRKVDPFHFLPLPLPQERSNTIATATASSSSAQGLKPLSAPAFDLGGPRKPLRAVTTLDQPPLELLVSDTGSDPNDVALELNRGLLISPQKNGGRRRGFTRGGLAEFAHHISNKTSTALTLWQRGLEREMSAGISTSFDGTTKSARSLSQLRYDARMWVIRLHRLSHSADVPGGAEGVVRSVLAECAILDAPDGIRIRSPQIEEGPPPSCSVLFSFTPTHQGSNRGIQKGDMLRDGAEVLMWKPLLEVNMPSETIWLCSAFLVLPK